MERVAARLVLNGKGVEITDTSEPEVWATKVLTPLPDGFGGTLTPEQDPKFFLNLLSQKLASGTYVHAVGPHDAGECPFEGGSEVHMRRAAVQFPLPSILAFV